MPTGSASTSRRRKPGLPKARPHRNACTASCPMPGSSRPSSTTIRRRRSRRRRLRNAPRRQRAALHLRRSCCLTGRVLLGAVIAAHGTKGEVRVKTFTLTPENVRAYGPLMTDDGRSLTIASLRATKPGEAVVHFDGISDRNAAEALRGAQLSVAREALPAPEADEFYHADLIGLPVEDVAHAALGTVRAIHNFGAGDVMEIQTPTGATEFVPFTDDIVVKVELPTRIVIAPPRNEDS